MKAPKQLKSSEAFAKLYQMLLEHNHRFEKIENKLLEHDGQLELIANTLLVHTCKFERIEDRMESFATKDDIAKIMNVLDKLLAINTTNSQEIVFHTHNIKNLNDRVDLLEDKVFN